MLIFFDIDATLVTTSRAGIAALQDAGRDLFGPAFTSERTDFAGRLDPLIIDDLLLNNGCDPTPAHADAMRAGYRRHLGWRLAACGIARALPGVAPLLDRLRVDGAITLALLTGNFPETGRMKLEAAGIDPDWFPIQVWASDAPRQPPRRGDLPPVGMERYHRRHGRPIPSSRVIIIGDTPHDVACAREHSCRCLAVATGKFACADLAAAGADLVLPDLSPTEEVISWIRNR